MLYDEALKEACKKQVQWIENRELAEDDSALLEIEMDQCIQSLENLLGMKFKNAKATYIEMSGLYRLDLEFEDSEVWSEKDLYKLNDRAFDIMSACNCKTIRAVDIKQSDKV